MRGSKAKAMRTADRPNPGRLNGGSGKEAVRANAHGQVPSGGRRFKLWMKKRAKNG